MENTTNRLGLSPAETVELRKKILLRFSAYDTIWGPYYSSSSRPYFTLVDKVTKEKKYLSKNNWEDLLNDILASRSSGGDKVENAADDSGKERPKTIEELKAKIMSQHPGYTHIQDMGMRPDGLVGYIITNPDHPLLYKLRYIKYDPENGSLEECEPHLDSQFSMSGDFGSWWRSDGIPRVGGVADRPRVGPHFNQGFGKSPSMETIISGLNDPEWRDICNRVLPSIVSKKQEDTDTKLANITDVMRAYMDYRETRKKLTSLLAKF